MKLEFSEEIFKKYSNIIPSSVSQVVASRQTDMTKLIVVFRNFANAPRNFVRNHNIVSIMTSLQ